jgi:hypothetical protein
LDFNHFNTNNNNPIAYIISIYIMEYDNPKLSNKDIIQSFGRGIRSDSLDIDGNNLKKE